MRTLGIDPGGEGAWALYVPPMQSPAGMLPEQVMLWDMPVNEVTVGKSTRKRIDMLGVLELIDNICMLGAPDRVLIEQVGGMPGQASGFAFGFGVGVVHMALTARGVKFETVTPTTWKKALKAPKDKKEAAVRAEELMPEQRGQWRVPHKTQKDKTVLRPDRAEAALLAYYAATVR